MTASATFREPSNRKSALNEYAIYGRKRKRATIVNIQMDGWLKEVAIIIERKRKIVLSKVTLTWETKEFSFRTHIISRKFATTCPMEMEDATPIRPKRGNRRRHNTN